MDPENTALSHIAPLPFYTSTDVPQGTTGNNSIRAVRTRRRTHHVIYLFYPQLFLFQSERDGAKSSVSPGESPVARVRDSTRFSCGILVSVRDSIVASRNKLHLRVSSARNASSRFSIILILNSSSHGFCEA